MYRTRVWNGTIIFKIKFFMCDSCDLASSERCETIVRSEIEFGNELSVYFHNDYSSSCTEILHINLKVLRGRFHVSDHRK